MATAFKKRCCHFCIHIFGIFLDIMKTRPHYLMLCVFAAMAPGAFATDNLHVSDPSGHIDLTLDLDGGCRVGSLTVDGVEVLAGSGVRTGVRTRGGAYTSGAVKSAPCVSLRSAADALRSEPLCRRPRGCLRSLHSRRRRYRDGAPELRRLSKKTSRHRPTAAPPWRWTCGVRADCHFRLRSKADRALLGRMASALSA